MDLPVQPSVPPMLAELARALPEGGGWLYEPKWDGFRAIVFWDGGELLVQSRELKPLNRYFPELVDGLKAQVPSGSVLDGEIVIATSRGLDFDLLQQRIHPAESRVRLLSRETPASLVAFDLLAAAGEDVRPRPLAARREQLTRLLESAQPPVHLTPATTDVSRARDWFERFEGAGLDGVVAKRLEDPYRPGQRTMLKIKHQRTLDCVVGGFRWYKGEAERAVGSLLLGLYDGQGVLQYVGHTSSFRDADRRELVGRLEPLRGAEPGASFGAGRTPGGPSRWSGDRDLQWESVRPTVVCEVAFDHLQAGERFRHAATFLRWRPDRVPASCTFDQIRVAVPTELQDVFGA